MAKKTRTQSYFPWVLALALAACGLAQAQVPTEPQTWHVDGSHTGEEDGSALTPFNTIGEAMGVVFPERGDTVLVRPGTYEESFLIPPGVSLIAERGPEETYVTGDPEATETLILLTEDTLLQGFTVGPIGGNAAAVFGGYTAEVRNCVFIHSFAGLAIADGATAYCYNSTFYGNQVSINLEGGGILADARNNILAVDTVGIYLNEGATATTAYNCFFGIGPAVFGGAPGETDFRANPALVDPENDIYHVRATSGVKDRGDPDAAFNDLDGSRNDVGADGGPFAVADELAPFIVVEATMGKGASLDFALDASLSFDSWGIQRVEWDTDLSDGLGFGELAGETIDGAFEKEGRHLVGIRVTDHAGLSSVRTLAINVGTAPPVSISSSKRASAAPFRTDLRALQGGAVDELAWDFGLDGSVDSLQADPTYILPESLLPGTHTIGLFVEDDDALAQSALPLTLTKGKVIAAKVFEPGDTGTISAASGGALGGTSLTFPQFSVTSEVVAAIAEPNAASLPDLPEGDVIALVEFGPDNQAFPRRLAASVPLRTLPASGATVSIHLWDAGLQDWTEDGIHFARINEEGRARILFETAKLGVFVVTASKADDGGDGDFVIICNQTGEPIFADTTGDLGVLGALMMALLFAGIARRRTARE